MNPSDGLKDYAKKRDGVISHWAGRGQKEGDGNRPEAFAASLLNKSTPSVFFFFFFFFLSFFFF
jgi:hypothetical protein